MGIASKLDQLHYQARRNRWLQYFAVFNRIGLAAGFLPSGFVKIMGERFTTLSNNHPMGRYLEAFHQTGFYYPFVGVMQMLAAILLLIPRTATIGAVIYFPIILNICILSLGVCFDGSLLSSPLMVLANLYLLCWDYHKLKYLLPFHYASLRQELPQPAERINRFPVKFFAGVVLAIGLVMLSIRFGYTIKPHNTITDCVRQCADSANPEACQRYCDCIHTQGQPYEKCVEAYRKAIQ